MKKIATFTGLILLPSALFARWGSDCWNTGSMRAGWFGGYIPGGGLLLIIATFLELGLLVFLAYRFAGGKKKTEGESGSALDIAKKRYAKGEISEEEFGKIKDDIG